MALTPKQINDLLAQTRDQKFRKKTEARLDGYSKSKASNTGKKRSGEALDNLTKANKTKDYTNTAKVNKDRVTDPKWLNAIHKGIEKRKENPTWKENNKKQLDKNHEARKRPIMTPDGEFASVREAAVFYGRHETTIKTRLDRKWAGYYYIER